MLRFVKHKASPPEVEALFKGVCYFLREPIIGGSPPPNKKEYLKGHCP